MYRFSARVAVRLAADLAANPCTMGVQMYRFPLLGLQYAWRQTWRQILHQQENHVCEAQGEKVDEEIDGDGRRAARQSRRGHQM